VAVYGTIALPAVFAPAHHRGCRRQQRFPLKALENCAASEETGLRIAVCHFPPATSKWNKIEHRLFSFISQNWRGKPLTSFQTLVSLIVATTTCTGL
jgi:hypothetical protein